MLVGHKTALGYTGHANFLVEGLTQVFIIRRSVQRVLVLVLGFELH